jgi:DNA gyrase subunit B
MYIGSRDTLGLHSLLWELIVAAVAETQAAGGSVIDVVLARDGSAGVVDRGRGLPSDQDPRAGQSILERLLTAMGACRLHGISPAVICALSETMEVAIRCDGLLWRQSFQRGQVTGDLRSIVPVDGTGTRITFKPDDTIFPQPAFDTAVVAARLFDLACLHPGLRLNLRDERTGQEQAFYHPDGLADLLRHLNRQAEPWHSPIHFRGREGEVEIAVALQYVKGQEEVVVRGYANSRPVQAGTHVTGLRAAVVGTLHAYLHRLLGRTGRPGSEENVLLGEDFREGLTCVVAVTVPELQLGGATRYFLNNPEVEPAVSTLVGRELSAFLDDNPVVALTILGHVIRAAMVRWQQT